MTDFTLKYEDVLIARPEMVTLIEHAMKGSLGLVAELVDPAFDGLTKGQIKHFSKLITSIHKKASKKRVTEKLLAAKQAAEVELSKEVTVWDILPKSYKVVPDVDAKVHHVK